MSKPDVYKTENEYGCGEVRSWASILDDNCREQAEAISRAHGVEGYVALMPDAHFGYGPPVGSAIKTRDCIMPYSVGVDIGCGMLAVATTLCRADLRGHERRILGEIRKRIPSGNASHERPTAYATIFTKLFGEPLGYGLTKNPDRAREIAARQFGTLGGGNHCEVCEDETATVWLLLHSGSRGIGNQLATAHVRIAQELCKAERLESKEFAYLSRGTAEYDAYLADLWWAQAYAREQRNAMMGALIEAVGAVSPVPFDLCAEVACHHNYAEELEPGLFLTRKGAIDASAGKLGIVPGSMGAASYIVEGLGNEEAYNTSAHGAGRTMGRNVARKSLDVEVFKSMMGDRTWDDRNAGALLDESPTAYKPIEQVMADSVDLIRPVHTLHQFINYKGVEARR